MGFHWPVFSCIRAEYISMYQLLIATYISIPYDLWCLITTNKRRETWSVQSTTDFIKVKFSKQ